MLLKNRIQSKQNLNQAHHDKKLFPKKHLMLKIKLCSFLLIDCFKTYTTIMKNVSYFIINIPLSILCLNSGRKLASNLSILFPIIVHIVLLNNTDQQRFVFPLKNFLLFGCKNLLQKLIEGCFSCRKC
jgi:hypothetical protein